MDKELLLWRLVRFCDIVSELTHQRVIATWSKKMKVYKYALLGCATFVGLALLFIRNDPVKGGEYVLRSYDFRATAHNSDGSTSECRFYQYAPIKVEELQLKADPEVSLLKILALGERTPQNLDYQICAVGSLVTVRNFTKKFSDEFSTRADLEECFEEVRRKQKEFEASKPSPAEVEKMEAEWLARDVAFRRAYELKKVQAAKKAAEEEVAKVAWKARLAAEERQRAERAKAVADEVAARK